MSKCAGMLIIVCLLSLTEMASAFYDANLGRWLNRDPIGENGGLNVYGFVSNSPIHRFDPLGLEDGNLWQDILEEGEGCNGTIQRELTRTYKEMKDKNVRGADQFFHCLAACRAVQAASSRCCGGRGRAQGIVREALNTKEFRDFLLNLVGEYGEKQLSHEEMMKDIERDKAANEQGIKAPKEKSCEQSCSSLLDGLPPNRRQFMEDYFKK